MALSVRMPRLMAFIDGENVVARYQTLIRTGRRPHPKIVHVPDEFAWSPHLVLPGLMEPIRAYYYTSVIGDADRVREVEALIRAQLFCPNESQSAVKAYLYPRVFKKPKKSQKTTTVDIQLTVDALSHTFQNDLDAVLLITGDGDYVSLARQIVARGKRLFVAAFSVGLSTPLQASSDQFMDLDPAFVSTLPPAA
jgi:hypothetical protein